MRSGMSKDIIKPHHRVQSVFFFFPYVCIKMGNKGSENVWGFQKLFITPPFATLISTLPQTHPHRHTHTSSQSLPKTKAENWDGDTGNQREEDVAGSEERCLDSIKCTAIRGKIRWQQQERNEGLEGEPTQRPKHHPSDYSALKHPSLPQSCQLTASLGSC